MERQYYVIRVPNPNSQIQDALDACVGQGETQRYSLDGSDVLIKTNAALIKGKADVGVSMNTLFPPGLTTELTYEEALVLMQTSEWQVLLNLEQ